MHATLALKDKHVVCVHCIVFNRTLCWTQGWLIHFILKVMKVSQSSLVSIAFDHPWWGSRFRVLFALHLFNVYKIGSLASCILNAWLMVLDPMVPLPWCFEVIMEWHSTYIPLGYPPFSLSYALLQYGVTAHQWLAPSHSWPAVSTLGRQVAGSSSSWSAGHWCIS